MIGAILGLILIAWLIFLVWFFLGWMFGVTSILLVLMWLASQLEP